MINLVAEIINLKIIPMRISLEEVVIVVNLVRIPRRISLVEVVIIVNLKMIPVMISFEMVVAIVNLKTILGMIDHFVELVIVISHLIGMAIVINHEMITHSEQVVVSVHWQHMQQEHVKYLVGMVSLIWDHLDFGH